MNRVSRWHIPQPKRSQKSDIRYVLSKIHTVARYMPKIDSLYQLYQRNLNNKKLSLADGWQP